MKERDLARRISRQLKVHARTALEEATKLREKWGTLPVVRTEGSFRDYLLEVIEAFDEYAQKDNDDDIFD